MACLKDCTCEECVIKAARRKYVQEYRRRNGDKHKRQCQEYRALLKIKKKALGEKCKPVTVTNVAPKCQDLTLPVSAVNVAWSTAPLKDA